MKKTLAAQGFQNTAKHEPACESVANKSEAPPAYACISKSEEFVMPFNTYVRNCSEIEVTSQNDANSSLTMLLDPYKKETETKSDASNAAGAVTRKTDILVVDDISSNAKLAAMIFSKAGYHCDIAQNGQEAVELALQNNYKLILMDNVMPVMSGIEATRQILAHKKVTVVGITGNILQEDQDEFFQAGAVCVIQKPADKSKLLNLCSVYCQKESPALRI